jgi:putative protease
MELLAPGGCLETALVAFDAGADAVYVGLPRFSARSAASNLNSLELRRLKAAAESRGRKIHLALNTIVTETEWAELRQTVWTAADSGVDAIIVQDWGVLSWIRRNLPEMVLHASTQMAVHNAPGARFLQKSGVSRVVLAREMTLDEVAAVSKEAPGLELEVFIHGALCYGVSGLCLASGRLLGRSANRGDCAQICRTWFEGPRGREHCLSTRDLRLGSEVLRLAEAGVASLKIEGRMKGPAYVDATIRYYRSILDGKADEAAGKASRLAFARPSTLGFFREQRGESLLATDYPGHRGLPLGRVTGRRGRFVSVTPTHDLEVRDGVLIESTPGAVRTLRVGSRSVFEVRAGQGVEVEFDSIPSVGSELRLLSHGPGPRFHPLVPEPWHFPLTLCATLLPGEIRWRAEGFPGGGSVEGWAALPMEAARTDRWQTALEEGLGVPKDQPFRVGTVTWINKTGWNGVFVPPTRWKSFKRGLWESLALGPALRQNSAEEREKPIEPFPSSASWVPALWPDFVRPGGPAGDVFVLLPLQFDPDRDLEPLVKTLENRSEPFLLVVNNPGHLEVARRLASNPASRFAFGYAFHAANRTALNFLSGLLPRVTAVCAWQELGHETATWGGALLVPPEAQTPAPDFLSRFCVRKHAWGGDCRDCAGCWTADLNQKGIKWTLRADRCLTSVIRDPGSSARTLP